MADERSNELVRTERLAQLGALLAGFAHEIRNPLSTIGLNLQLVKEDLGEGESPRDKRARKRLDVVEGEVRRLQGMLDEFLSFARRPELDLQPVDINGLLQSVVEFCVPEMDSAGVSLKFYPGSGLLAMQVDANHLRAALVNLLRNAQDACEPGDEVLVSSQRDADQVLIQVTDTGQGMEPDVLDQVFRPYFSTKKGGTGLGLPTTRRIVREHGGDLTVTSEPGRGTQFTMTLPIRAPAPRLGVDVGPAAESPDPAPTDDPWEEL